MLPRTLAEPAQRLASQYPVVTLTGPRQSGKTTLCRAVFADKPYVSLEDPDVRARAKEDPRGLLQSLPDGAVFDEIQRAPELTSYLQAIVDQRDEAGLFILTGSHQFEVIERVSQSLAGRTALLTLLPFSYDEVYGGERVDLSTVLLTGFYPRIHDKQLDPSEALGYYVRTYLERDLRNISAIRSLDTFERFLSRSRRAPPLGRRCWTVCATMAGSAKSKRHISSTAAPTPSRSPVLASSRSTD